MGGGEGRGSEGGIRAGDEEGGVRIRRGGCGLCGGDERGEAVMGVVVRAGRGGDGCEEGRARG